MLPVGDIELSDEILEKVIYGPEKFVCNADAPTVLEVVISSVDFNGHQAPYSLIVVNGEVDGGFRVTNARILVNNVEIFNQSDFAMKVEPLERGIELNASSNLRVELLDESGNCRSCEVTNNSNEPFAYYPFNENANDESINVNDGVVNGASLTSDRFGNANSAYHFDGIDDFMNCGSNSSLKVSDAISISLWVKPEENSSIPQLLTKEEEYKLSLYPENKISFALSNANPGWKDRVTSSTAGLNEWTHIVFTYNASTGKILIYRNNNQVYETTESGLIFDAHPTQNELWIGYRQRAVLNFFHGGIDDVRLFNYEISPCEVEALYIENGWTGN